MFYKRADHQNPKWTVRSKIPTLNGHVVKSTKTTDDFEVRRFAVLAGHANLRTTQLYIDANADAQVRIVNLI